MMKCCRALSMKCLITVLCVVCLSACGGKKKQDDSDETPDVDLRYSISGTIVVPVGSDVDQDVQVDGFFSKNNAFVNAQTINNPTFLGGYLSALQGIYSTNNNQTFPHTFSEDLADIYRVSLLSGQTVSVNAFFADNGAPENSEINLGFRLYSTSDTDSPVVASSLVEEGSTSLQVPANDEYYIVLSADSNGTVPLLYTMSISQSIANDASQQSLQHVHANDAFVPGEVIVKFKTNEQGDVTTNRSIQTRAASSVTKQTAVMQSIANIKSMKKKAHLGKLGDLMSFDLSDSGSVSSAFTQATIPGLNSSQFNALPKDYRDKWQTAQRINELRQDPNVEYAEPNYLRKAAYIPTDPQYPKQWHYPLISLPSAWNVSTGNGVTVAVIDSGIASGHVDLDDNIDSLNGWDFISNIASAGDGNGPDNNPEDEAGSFHGSHVAGIIAAEEGNNLGVVGSAFNARIMPLRVLGIDGFGSDSEISQAILFAAGLPNSSGTVPSQKADIINLSLGSESFSFSLQSAVNAALSEGVIIIAAAGNNATSTPFYPAAFDGVVSVSAVSESKTLASFSNYGSTIDVAAPGGSGINDLNNDRYRDGILSTVYASFYEELQGTSMAAPHVAGVAALMKSIDPSLDNTKFNLALSSGQITDNIGSSSRFGAGLINAAKAMAWIGESISTQLNVFPSSFSFVGKTTSSTFSLTNPGEGSVIVESIIENEAWLELIEVEVDEQKLGTYRLQVDRTGLDEGSNFATELRINYRVDGGDLETQSIQVFLSVPTLASVSTVGQVYVLLTRKPDIDAAEENNDPFVEIYDVALGNLVDGQYQFSFPSVPPGEYILDASTDNDNDYIVSEQGEAVGAYPLLSQPIVITVSNRNISGLDFSMGYSSVSNSKVNQSATKHKPASRLVGTKKQLTESGRRYLRPE